MKIPNENIESLSILLVEDNHLIQQMVKRILEVRGWTVACADNGLAAVEQAAIEIFDLILMDIQMPVMDGLRATMAIRVQEFACNRMRTPIFALTAQTNSVDRARAFQAGMDKFLNKPISPQELYSQIEKFDRSA